MPGGIWSQIATGDAEAFEHVYAANADRVHGFAFRRSGSWDIADEITSGVFLEAWRRRAEVDLEPDDAILPWLLGVAANLMRNAGRKEQRYQAFLSTAGTAAERPRLCRRCRRAAGQPTRAGPAPGSRWTTSTDDDRDLLLLCVAEGLTPGEVATALAVPAGTVRSRLSRARRPAAAACSTSSTRLTPAPGTTGTPSITGTGTGVRDDVLDDDDVDRLLQGDARSGRPARRRASVTSRCCGRPWPRRTQLEEGRARRWHRELVPALATVTPIGWGHRRRRVLGRGRCRGGTVVLSASAAATIIYERAGNRSEVRCLPKIVTDYENPKYGDNTEIDGDSASDALAGCARACGEQGGHQEHGALGPAAPARPRVRHRPSSRASWRTKRSGVFPVDPTHHSCEDVGLPRSDG